MARHAKAIISVLSLQTRQYFTLKRRTHDSERNSHAYKQGAANG